MNNQLIKVTQLPIIEERLRSMKEFVDHRVSEATSLVCNEETIQTVKKVRAEMRKELAELEEQKKAVKMTVLEPYNAFEQVYEECISRAYKSADYALKSKIDAVEDPIKKECEYELRNYFAELTYINHMEWLEYEECGIIIDMASAKQKSHKKLKEQIKKFVEKVANDTKAISSMQNAMEIQVEYKQCYDVAKAISIVQGRHARIEIEKLSHESLLADMQKEEESINRVNAVAPPAIQENSVSTDKFYKCTFTVNATKEQLKNLKRFMQENQIIFE